MQKSLKPKNTAGAVPAELADMAFMTIGDVCATVRMSASWVHNEVAGQRFPQPVRLGPRCTRWPAASVKEWMIRRAAAAAVDSKTAEVVTARAKKASEAARVKRLARSGVVTRAEVCPGLSSEA